MGLLSHELIYREFNDKLRPGKEVLLFIFKLPNLRTLFSRTDPLHIMRLLGTEPQRVPATNAHSY